MKLSKELLLQAVNAAFEFNAENDDANAHVTYDAYSLTLGLNVFSEEKWVYYKVSTRFQLTSELHVNSHEENLEGFIAALQENAK